MVSSVLEGINCTILGRIFFVAVHRRNRNAAKATPRSTNQNLLRIFVFSFTLYQITFRLLFAPNSDLSKFHDFLFGNAKRPIPTEAFALGTEVHRLILEPKHSQNAEASQQAKEMADCFKVAFGALKRYDLHEHVVLWEAENGLPLKSKLDLYNNKSIVMALADIKTTSATSFEQFMEQDFDRFNYAQQAAFYMDSVQAHTYELFCVSKIFPYETWKIDLWADSKPVEKARKRYKPLLNEWPKHNFIPDTWNK